MAARVNPDHDTAESSCIHFGKPRSWQWMYSVILFLRELDITLRTFIFPRPQKMQTKFCYSY